MANLRGADLSKWADPSPPTTTAESGLCCQFCWRAQIRGLHWKDVDLEKARLYIRHTIQQDRGRLHVGPPKTDKSRRTIPLPWVSVQALKRHHSLQSAERLAAGTAWHESGLLFTTKTGAPLGGQNLARILQGQLRAAGLPPRCLHHLRHGCSSLLQAMGVPPAIVMQILGHSNLTTTMMIYAEVSTAAMQDALRHMDFLKTAV